MRSTSNPCNSETKVSERKISNVVTPNNLRLSYTPAFFNTSAAIATVVFTGLVIIPTQAFGQVAATFSIKLRTIPALILNKSERSIPGLRATPAEINTTSAPFNAGVGSSPPKPSTLTAVGIWLTSLATPGVTGAISYNDNSDPAGSCNFNNNANA